MSTRIQAFVMAACTGTMLIGAGLAAASDVRGKTVDDSSSLGVLAAPNTEAPTPLTNERLPSSVLVRDLEAMRRSAATLPTTQATEVATLSESELGALFESGHSFLLPATRATLASIAESVRGRRGLRFLVVGHADAQRLSAPTRRRYRDNQGLSEARAFEVAQYLRVRLGLGVDVFTIRGAGDREPVADNATAAGMAKNRRVELQIWYDQEQTEAQPAQAEIQRDLCERHGEAQISPAALRITLDGQPVTAADDVNEADRQRCVDVATTAHDIQIQFDPLKTEPALNVVASPANVVAGEPMELATYSNYVHWIRKAEIRFFLPAQDPRERPLLVLPVKIGDSLRWTPDASVPADTMYVLRVYDEKGRFDETRPKRLTILERGSLSNADRADADEKLAGYGESSLRIRNIPVLGGSVTVSGRDVPKGAHVKALGAEVPVDGQGSFVTRQLLPAGSHMIEVETSEENGEPVYFRRNLTIPKDTWFYVALGELTAAANHTTGPAELVTQDTDRYDKKTEITGRGALYAKGKVRDDYLVTLSADTRERPIEDLFSNFTAKDPRFLLERIDEERAYPVFGDDSTSEWDAPTNGRFYARVERHDSRAVWGNFQTTWTGLELNQFSRGLYGADLQLKTDSATSFGERSSTTDVFGAEPGTLDSREEFRGTGGFAVLPAPAGHHARLRAALDRRSRRDVRHHASAHSARSGCGLRDELSAGAHHAPCAAVFCCRRQHARAARQPERQSGLARGDL